MTAARPPPVLADSITKLGADAVGAVVVCGSHGGVYPGYLAAVGEVRAVVLNDAGVGMDAAGIGSLAYLQALGIAAACVAHSSCRIGDAKDMLLRGMISHANAHAAALGVRAGQACAEAAALLTAAAIRKVSGRAAVENRRVVSPPGARRRIVLIDSASLVEPEDAGQIVVTGSHGGLVGGDARFALQVDAVVAAFNDAGVGPDACGRTRLPALDARGVAAVTVAHTSARIGDALSTYHDGVVSAANALALRLGARIGLPAQAFIDAAAR